MEACIILLIISILALREAIYQIRISFDDYLDSFAIDRKYVNKWQKFVKNEE